jgi:hypothetical protein
MRKFKNRLRYNYLKIRGKMQVFNFYSLFRWKAPFPSKTLIALVDVRIGNFTLHRGAEINLGVTIDGVDLFALVGKNLQVEVVGSTYIIRGVQYG